LALRPEVVVETLYTDHISSYTEGVLVAGGRPETPGRGFMSDPSGSDPSGSGDSAREAAKDIADQVAPLLKRARAKGFDVLAYLLAMALKESRRLSEE